MGERPQPRHIDAVGGKVVHEPQLEFVVVDGRREVAVENLEAVVRRHVERVLDVLDGDVALGHAVDVVPKFLGEDLLRRVQTVLGDDPGRDLALRVQQAAGLQQLPLRVAEAAGDRGHRLAFHVHGLQRRIEDRLELAHRGPQGCIAGGHVGRFRAGDPALPIGIVEPSLHPAGKDVFQRRLLTRGQRLLGHEHQTQQALAQLVDRHRAQGQRVVPRAAIGIARLDRS